MITVKGVRAGDKPRPYDGRVLTSVMGTVADVTTAGEVSKWLFVRSRLLQRYLFIFLPFGLHSVNRYPFSCSPLSFFK